MNYTVIFTVSCMLTCNIVSAQKVFLRHDTIFAYNHPYAKFKRGNNKPERYAIYSLNGSKLIELHDGRVEVNGRRGYVVTFSEDKRQAMVPKDAGFPFSFIKEMVTHSLIAGMSVNETQETEFIKTHPLPNGYTDVEQLINY